MNNNKWTAFENSGKISDYLSYKGIEIDSFSDLKGEGKNADYDKRNCNSRETGR